MLYSQNVDSAEKKKPFIVFKADSIDDGRWLLTPFITPGYTPELGIMLSGGGYLSFKTDRGDINSKRSSIPLSFSYSSVGAKVFNSFPIIYLMGERLIFEGEFWYKTMPDHYFGVGFNETIDKAKSDETSYHRKWWLINSRMFWELKKNWFVGLNIDFNYTYGSGASPEVKQDESFSKYNEMPFNSGLGFIARYDSRDLPKNSYSGFFLEYSSTFYGDYLGGNNDYNINEIDVRNFFSVGKPGRVLAIQAMLRVGVGEVPYGEMSLLGTPFDLRGYLWGRLRDKSMAFTIVEYRYKLYFNKKASRHSLVTWTGVGTMFSEETEVFYAAPNFGIGYRLEFQPRVSLRLDFGLGRSTKGFYISFQEAF